MGKIRLASAKMRAHLERVHAAMVTHGMSGTRTHSVWMGMRDRCRNKNAKHFARYGGRGIAIDPAWDEFAQFLADMGEQPKGLTLERIDNDGPYSAKNCKWATRSEQANNRQYCRVYTHDGQSMTLSQWARLVGLRRNALDKRLSTGMALGEALFAPTMTHQEIVARSNEEKRARTHCKWGHEWTPENSGKDKGGRRCRACHRINEGRRNAAKRSQPA